MKRLVGAALLLAAACSEPAIYNEPVVTSQGNDAQGVQIKQMSAINANDGAHLAAFYHRVAVGPQEIPAQAGLEVIEVKTVGDAIRQQKILRTAGYVL